MHAEEFLKEVLDSPLCPKNFESIYRDFQHYQQLAMDTLNEFHRVCEKNGIPYQLAFGSLLGAIRDDGQIPWDYDVDVWVPYCDVPALISALQKDLSKDYYFCCHQLNPKWDHYMMRLAPKGYRTEVLHVDVFYMIGTPKNKEEYTSFGKQVQQMYNLRIYKLVHLIDNFKRHPKLLSRFFFKKIKYIFVTLPELNKQFNILVNKYPFKDAEHCMSFSSGASIYRKELLWDTELITNTCGEFRVTKNYDECLRTMYGDYKYLFPLQVRLKEMMRHYRALTMGAKKK